MFVSSKSPEAQEICDTYYGKGRETGHCAGCPLTSKCHKVTPPGREAFDRWMGGINEAARQFKLKPKTPTPTLTLTPTLNNEI